MAMFLPFSCKIHRKFDGLVKFLFWPGDSHGPFPGPRRTLSLGPRSLRHELLAFRLAASDSTDGARIRRELTRPSRHGVEPSPDVSARDDAAAGRPRNAGRARAGG